MSENKRLKDFLTRLFENIIIQIIIGLGFALGFIYLLKDYILSFISYTGQTSIPLWMTIVIVIVVIFLIILFNFLLKKKHSSPRVMSVRMRNGHEQEIPFEISGLKYIAYIPEQLFRPDEYVWLTGPFCPDCTLELERKGKVIQSWYCEGCGKKFKALKKFASDERGFVRDIVFAEIFRKKKFKKK